MITAVALRLFPRADVRSVVLAAVESPAQALRLFELLYAKCGARLQASSISRAIAWTWC